MLTSNWHRPWLSYWLASSTLERNRLHRRDDPLPHPVLTSPLQQNARPVMGQTARLIRG